MISSVQYTSFEEMGIHGIPTYKKGWHEITCPFCSHLRKPENRTEKCFHIEIQTKKYKCHNCGIGGKVDPFAKKYKKPEPMYPKEAANPISMAVQTEWFRRGISSDTLKHFGVISHPQDDNITVIPFKFNGETFNLKKRWMYEVKDANGKPILDEKGKPKRKKDMRFYPGARLILYNLDSITVKGEIAQPGEIPYVIVTAGEPDVWSWHEVGKKHVVSPPSGETVPNGDSPKMQWLDDSMDYFDNIPIIYIASDDDVTGRRFRDEVARRMGVERVKFITFPKFVDVVGADGQVERRVINDTNDVLREETLGQSMLLECFDNAHWHPIKGIADTDEVSKLLDDVYEYGRKPYLKIGLPTDELMTWNAGYACTMVLAQAQSAKSQWVLNVSIRLAFMYGIKTGIYSPESGDVDELVQMMIEIFTGKVIEPQFSEMNKLKSVPVDRRIYEYAKDFIFRHFFFITKKELPNITVDKFLEMGKRLVRQHGIKMLIVDPYNKLTDGFSGADNMMMSVMQNLNKVDMFSAVNDVHSLIATHPSGEHKDGTKVTSLKQANGGPQNDNIMAYGATLNRDKSTFDKFLYSQGIGDAITYVQCKCKKKSAGRQGEVTMAYHWETGRFGTYDEFGGNPTFETYLDWQCYEGKRPYIDSRGEMVWAEFSGAQSQPLTPTIVQPPKPIDYFANFTPKSIDITQPGNGDEPVPF